MINEEDYSNDNYSLADMREALRNLRRRRRLHRFICVVRESKEIQVSLLLQSRSDNPSSKCKLKRSQSLEVQKIDDNKLI